MDLGSKPMVLLWIFGTYHDFSQTSSNCYCALSDNLRLTHTLTHSHTSLLSPTGTRHSPLSSLVSRLSSLSLAPSTRLSPSYSVEFTN